MESEDDRLCDSNGPLLARQKTDPPESMSTTPMRFFQDATHKEESDEPANHDSDHNIRCGVKASCGKYPLVE